MQQHHHIAAGAAIEGGGGFIGQQQPRPGCQGPGNRHPLLLAAGEVVGQLVQLVAQAHGPQPFARLVAAGPVTEAAQQVGAHLHVLLGAEAAQQVVALENHADRAAQLLALPAARSRQLLAEHLHLAGLHLAQGPHQGEQGGFAATGGTGEQHHLAAGDREIHPFEHLAAHLALAIPMAQASNLNRRRT